MTSKERVLAAVTHEEPDRVPIGEYGYGRELIEPALGRKSYLSGGLETIKAYWQGKRDEIVADRKKSKVELVRRLEWDIVLCHPVIGKETRIDSTEQIAPDKWRDEQGNILTYSYDTDSLFITEQAPRRENPPEQVPNQPVSFETADSELEEIRYIVKELGKTHFLFSGPLNGHPRLSFSVAGGCDLDVWCTIYEDPDAFGRQYLEGMTAVPAESGLKVCKREGMDGVMYSWDFGYNKGPFVAPEIFRKAILPGLSAWVALAHKHGLVTLLHACGNNRVLMDMIVESGFDVYQSLQKEMDIKDLKKRYGNKITFWGGVLAGDLVTSTPDRVKEEGIAYLKACKPGGGYIYGTSHSVMPAAKFENYMAMHDAWKECGRY